MSLWEDAIGYGLHADRPAAGAPGAIYCESDTGLVMRDNGTIWDTVAGAPAPPSVVPLTVQIVNSGNEPDDNTIHLTEANIALIADGVPLIAVLPDPAANTGLLCYVSGTSGTPYVYNHDFETPADRQGTTPAAWVSDGTAWWRVV